ncbi:MAG: hypothetical protein K2K24_02160 [Clostridia bacterium]|nr:hypothetical protein [Clostridia bacterium]
MAQEDVNDAVQLGVLTAEQVVEMGFEFASEEVTTDLVAEENETLSEETSSNEETTK